MPRLGGAPSQPSQGFASASGGVRPILQGQAPRVQRTQPAPTSNPAASGHLPRTLPAAPSAWQRAPGSASTLPSGSQAIRPPLGTATSPRWDSRPAPAATLRGTPQATLPATPRASLPRTVAPATSTAGVRYGAPGTPAASRWAAPSSAPRTAGVRYGAPTSPRTGYVAAPSTTPHYSGSAGAGVRYGGAPHASGVYYPSYRGTPYYGRPWYGYGIGHRWYAPPVYGGYGYGYGYYSEPSVVLNVWGFGWGCCEPSLPAYEAVPYGYAAPAWPAEAPGYVMPAPQPLYEAPAAPSVVEPAPAPQAWPEPAPEPAPLPPQPPVPEPSTQAPAGQDPEPTTPEGGAPALKPEDEQALRESIDAFREGRYGAAQAALEAVVARTPDLGHAWLGIAHAAFAQGRNTRASEAVTKAALLGAFPRGYAFDPRMLYAKPDDFLARKQALEERVRNAPKDADARLVLVWLRVSLGERDLARADLDALLALRPGDEAAPLLSLALLPAVPAPQEGAAAPQPSAPAQPR